MDSETRAKIEALKAKNPKLAQALEEAYRAMKECQEREARDEKSVQDEENPPHQKAATPPALSPADDPAPLPPQGPAEAPREAEPVQKLTTWRFEWRDYLSKAEALLAKWGHLERLGPLVRLLVALAIREGARLDPSREAHVFLAQWEVAEMLGVSRRTVDRWLNDPRYEQYRKVARWWIAWETWYTSGQGIGQEQAVKGGTLWRVRVRPLVRPGRPMKVLAPYLALPWRDLGKDAREGRTRRVLSDPDSMSPFKDSILLGKGLTLRTLIGKPLPTWEIKNISLLNSDTARDIRELLRAASIPGGRNGRQRWAQAVASAISQALLRREGWFDLVRPYEGFKVGVAV